MSNILQKPLILVDASSYLFRAYHALPPLMNTKGQATGAVYGVINMLRKLLKDYQPTHIAMVFDPKGKTFRDDLYPDYKANRPSMPEELSSQIQPLFNIIKALGIPLLIVDGYEADDVIGTLAKQANKAGMETLISTGDKDMAQLVNDNITLINTMTNKILDINGVEEKFGIPPTLIVDYLTLMGDSVDNVPGVPKVGPKTAVKWLKAYGSLDAVMAHSDEISGKVGENLRQSLTALPLSKQLVTIDCDVPMTANFEALTIGEQDVPALISLFEALEFKTWLREVSPQIEVPVEIERQYETILTEAMLDKWIAQLQAATVFAFDTETTSLNYMDAQVVGVSFAVTAHQAAYLPMAHDYEGAPRQLSKALVWQKLKPLLEDEHKVKVGHNLKYDKNVLLNEGIILRGIAYDTMLEAAVYASGNRQDMDSLALKYLDIKTIHYEDVAGKGAKQKTFNQIALEVASDYAAEDADITLQLHQYLWQKLQKNSSLLSIFEALEMPLLSVIAKMEAQGVLIDGSQLQQQSQVLAKHIQQYQHQAYELAGEEFNLASPKQLQAILFDKLGLPITQKTPTGQPSTSEAVLQELAHDYPLPKIILSFRTLSKLKSTYTDKLPQLIHPKTGRVHTSYHQTGAATGRLSSSDPNLQNIPIRTEEGRKIRKAFIAPQGYRLVAADYSQIELRIMAHLSQDAGLLSAFARGDDIHKTTASEVFGVPMNKVTDDLRRHAKAINFGLMYGMSVFGLARELEIDRDAAKEYMDAYFQKYPGVLTYMDDTREFAQQHGYVETLYGRRLYLPEIHSRNKIRQKAAQRAAINGPLQGTAADIIKRAMLAGHQWLENSDIDGKMIMQVHDELIFEIRDDQIDKAIEAIAELMSGAANLAVKLEVGIGVGNNWDEAH